MNKACRFGKQLWSIRQCKETVLAYLCSLNTLSPKIANDVVRINNPGSSSNRTTGSNLKKDGLFYLRELHIKTKREYDG